MSAEGGLSQFSGIAARQAAVDMVCAVMWRGQFLDEALDEAASAIDDARDRGFARLLAATALRRKGQIDRSLSRFLERPLDRRSGPVRAILLVGAAQLMFLGVEPHAAISTAVDIAARHKEARRFKALINAVLRQVAANLDELIAGLPPALDNLPQWLETRLRADLGQATAGLVAEAHLVQADLDLSLKSPDAAAELVAAGGHLLPTGSVRFPVPYPAIPDLPGYAEGNWWVQDAAAALPARLLGNVSGAKVLDMCAAPGGKTLQLAAAGADVTALDISEQRLVRVHENLARTGLAATCVAHDAATYEPDALFDAILLDAPCSATGTIRRHPELPWVRQPDDIAGLVAQQRVLLRVAATMLKPGGTLVYAVCSLLAEEGPKQVQAFLNDRRDFARSEINAESLGLDDAKVTKRGDLRTLPCMSLAGHAGLDGFYAARLIRAAD
jgi:16S rRNA (cytosine967-C5)-methyltransferase